MIVMLTGCDDEISPREKYTDFLTKDGAWTLSSAQVDDVQIHTYDGMSVQFSKAEYRAANGGAMWAARGKWSFAIEDDRKLILDDGLETEIISINNTRLILSFMFTKDNHACGNIQSTAKVHKFSFERVIDYHQEN